MSDVETSLNYVRDAVHGLPSELMHTLAVELPSLKRPPRTVVTTGIGASEGPARALAYALAERGFAARFSSTSRFAFDPPRGELLVVFSQGLSPNARLTLLPESNFAARWLVTSVDTDCASEAHCAQLRAFAASGFTTVVIPPQQEPSTLIRLIGPCVATLLAFRLAAHLTGDAALEARLHGAPAAYRESTIQETLSEPSALALITIGVPSELAYGHRWKLLEALLWGDPPVWDALQFAHGPLQTYHDRSLTLLVLERGTGSPLLSRVGRVLTPERHRVLHLSSVNACELSFFEHTAKLDRLFLQQLESSPRNLFDWPARHGDEPLYGLASPL